MLQRNAVLMALALTGLAACADAIDAPREEPLPGEEDLDPGKADGATPALWTYYTVARTSAGGLEVRRWNQPDTKCADGKWKKACPIDAVDWSRAGFSPEDAAGAGEAVEQLRAILRGKLVLRDVDGRARAHFQATEVWESEDEGAPTGVALRIAPTSGCTSAGCTGAVGTRLNKGGASTATYTRIDVAGLDAVRDGLAGEDGVIVVGEITKSGGDLTFAAEQGWKRRVHSEADDDRTDGPTCGATVLSSFPKNELRVHLIDVGQGEAIFVQTPWRDSPDESLSVLVDAGPSDVMPGASPGGEVVVAHLLAAGLEEGDVLDALVITHAHDDHFGGVERVAESFGIARYADPGFTAGSSGFIAARKAAREHVEEHDGHMHVPAIGELVPRVFSDSDLFGPLVDATILWAADKPPSGRTTNPTGPDVNNTSIAMSLAWAGKRVLLLSDIESAVEAALIEAHDAGEIDLSASVLKVAHHGSTRSTSTELLNRVFATANASSWALISSGRRTFTGAYLPSDATIERLHEALPDGHVLSTENRDGHKVVGTEHGDDSVLVRINGSGKVTACYLP